MKSLHPSHFTDGSLPVFVFPNSLTFYADDQTSHKQVLTVYNPYDFVLRFKVLCTSPAKYTVVDSEGIVKPRCCIDIVIRHLDVSPGVTSQDKFRIHVSEHGMQKLLGKKEILAVLLPSREMENVRRSSPTPSRHSKKSSIKGGQIQDQYQQMPAPHSHSPSIWVILLAVGCLAAIMLPTQGDISSRLPDYLFLAVNQKLVAAFILGLITMAVLKTS